MRGKRFFALKNWAAAQLIFYLYHTYTVFAIRGGPTNRSSWDENDREGLLPTDKYEAHKKKVCCASREKNHTMQEGVHDLERSWHKWLVRKT